MLWKTPPAIKIYEALGCIADKRITINKDEGKVYSSSKSKYYKVIFDPVKNAIMCNDNGSYFREYLGYPAIAYLMKINKLNFSIEYSEALKGIKWKDLNMKHDKNKGKGIPNYDFDAVIKEVDKIILRKGINLSEFKEFLKSTLEQIISNKFSLLGKKLLPPKGY